MILVASLLLLINVVNGAVPKERVLKILPIHLESYTVDKESLLDSHLDIIIRLHNETSESEDTTNAGLTIMDWLTTVESEANNMLADKKNCYKWKYNCRNSQSKIILDSMKLCYCDSLCHSYGDCCLDEAITLLHNEKQENLQGAYCGQLDTWSPSSRGILMIGECPESRRGTMEDEFCHQMVPLQYYDMSFDIPVTSLSTNYTYRNYYCALCHEDVSNLLNMDFSVSCSPQFLSSEDRNMKLEDFLPEAKYTPGSRSFTRYKKEIPRERNSSSRQHWTMKSQSTYQSQTCIVQTLDNVHQFLHQFGTRTCLLPEVRNCDNSWPIQSDFKKCRTYSLRVLDTKTQKIFKNPHCARCNFVSSDRLACSNEYFYEMKRPRMLSFSALFTTKGLLSRKCNNINEIWNPFHNKCRKIICVNGENLQNGECIEQKVEFSERTDKQFNKTVLNNNCTMISLNDLQVFENDSIYDPKTDILYTKDRYMLHNNSFIFICAKKSYFYEDFQSIYYYTTTITLSISLLCLTFHIILYLCFKRLRTWHRRNVFCLCCALFAAQFLFLTGKTATQNFGFCVFLSVCLHYLWLVTFCWMNILSIDVWRTFRSHVSHISINKERIFMYYNIYSWGTPLIIIFIGLSFDFTFASSRFRPSYAGPKECWLNNKMGLLCFYFMPVGLIVIGNFILFLITSHKIHIQSKQTQLARATSQSLRRYKSYDQSHKNIQSQESCNQTYKIRFALYVKLAILQGLTWLICFIASFFNSPICAFVFIILNGFQGAAIVICFDIKKWIFVSMYDLISKRTFWTANMQSSQNSTSFYVNGNLCHEHVTDISKIENIIPIRWKDGEHERNSILGSNGQEIKPTDQNGLKLLRTTISNACIQMSGIEPQNSSIGEIQASTVHQNSSKVMSLLSVVSNEEQHEPLYSVERHLPDCHSSFVTHL